MARDVADFNANTVAAYGNNVDRRRYRNRLQIAGTPVLTGTQGVAYDGFTVEASGGMEPYEYFATNLPSGLDIDAETGEVFGTPDAAGTTEGIEIGVRDNARRVTYLDLFTLVIAAA